MKEDTEKKIGEIRIADEVVGVIACLAATEVEGVTAMNGGYTHDMIATMPSGSLNKCVKVSMGGGIATVKVSVRVKGNTTIPEVSKKIQERVHNSIVNMTGIQVAGVGVNIAGVDM